MSGVSVLFIFAFWMCAGLIAYTYAFYPPLVWLLSRWMGHTGDPVEVNDSNAPMISLLIVAHNEEAVIRNRLRNALSVDYPQERVETVLASDGSDDGTNAIVREFAGEGVRLIEISQRQGKAAAINHAMKQLQGEIVLLSDANTDFDPSAARKLVRWFRDPKVGAVCGRLLLTDPQTGRNVDSLYWQYETLLKQCESKIGGLLGANGAIYAIRRPMFVPVPVGTIIDDFVIPLLARLGHGCSILYESEAIAREQSAPDVREEFRRRSRIGAGNFQCLALLWPLLDPRRGWIAFTFFSHKILRWLAPFFVIGLLISSAALTDRPFYRIALCAQLAGYALACAVLFAPARVKLPRMLTLAAMFVSMNAALLAGFWRWITRNPYGTWNPTVRTPALENEST